ncbi:hypothetical protein H5410_020501 [Solanum commersonii]|uniref:Uncharacterized protein n=1 Tax=Solanum commersonii TaxID=4109 RepID=A0A9J5ZCK5_SOLCO|nr:hypothetical protein H5410_020501 [Solanum commersonii]
MLGEFSSKIDFAGSDNCIGSVLEISILALVLPIQQSFSSERTFGF